MTKRNYIDEIVAKEKRLHSRESRMDTFRRRVFPLVAGFRAIRKLHKDVAWRSEWLKYGAIGYVACIEGYFRILIADIIDRGEPFLSRVVGFKDIKFGADVVVAISNQKISMGSYVSHLLPLNGVVDVNSHLSVLLDVDFFTFYQSQPVSVLNCEKLGVVFPETIGNVERLFKLRHLHAHELATKEKFPLGKIEDLISSAACFVTSVDAMVEREWLGGEGDD